MSYWGQFDFHNRIRDILKQKKYKPNQEHHLGRYTFAMAYQIAIEFNILYPNVAVAMGYKVGGKGTNEKVSLSQYIARELSCKIKSGEITDIEGGFISNCHITDLVFDNNGSVLESTMIGTENDHSIFRYRSDNEENQL